MSYVLLGVAASLVGFMGGFLFGTIHGAKFAHQALTRASSRQGRIQGIQGKSPAR